jgi:enoyl-CoA hydratase/carnithine racemase
MTYNTLRYEVAENILTLTLNRPDQLNAFTVEMANELIDAFNRASTDDEVRAIVVTGEGRAFCAGMDLSVEGNVFGLNEGLAPTMADMNERLDDPEIIALGGGSPWQSTTATSRSLLPSTVPPSVSAPP